MLYTQWCVCTFLALFAALSIFTIDAKLHHNIAHKDTKSHHKSAHCNPHHKGAHCKPHHHKSEQKYQTIDVDPSGTRGSFKTIQAAIDSVPSSNNGWVIIRVAKGVYREQVKILQSKPFIYLKGDGQDKTRVQWAAHDSITSTTFSTRADNTIAKDMSFVNTFNYPPNATHNPRIPAVAALIQGDKSAFYRCGFYGVQDTLWDVKGRHYFKNCTIEGAVDFIFGAGQSHYEGCHISVVARSLGAPGYVTAQGRENEDDSNGFVFKNCSLDGSGKTYLGRAWRNHARVVFYNTYMSNIVVPQGWKPWAGEGHEDQLTFAENNCRGPGSDRSRRVSWAKKLNVPQLKEFTSTSFIDKEGWMKKLPSDFFD